MKRKELFQSLVLAGVLASGFAVVWGVIAIWAFQIGTRFVVALTPHTLMVKLNAARLFLPDGTPVVGYYQPGQHRQLRDLQGNPVAEPDGDHPFLYPVCLAAKYEVEEKTDWEH